MEGINGNCADENEVDLSILIPVYNVESYLSELLDTLLPDLPALTEIIFYDDFSSDDSLAVIRKYQQSYPDINIRVLCGQKNLGITRVRQCLLKASYAEYIWFIDSDDRVERQAVEQIRAILNQHHPDVVLFDYDVFVDDTGKVKHHEHLSIAPANTLLHQRSGELYRFAIMDGKHYFWNKVFRRTLVTDKCHFTIPAYEDIANTPTILNQCQTYFYYPHTLVHYRIWPNSIVQKISLKQAYGIEAYLTQAIYADAVVGDRKCCAYLLYKAHLYYFRLCRKLARINLPEKEKEAILLLAKQQYAEKPLSTCATILLLLRTGMWGKAFKLGLKSGLASLSGK
ncbi:MAG: glycosyltransferase family 2 protein [Snodgrassella sp.]|uniref:glycosyltransferase family 2 protein n=1 Tax=Snodgrassella sp. TaxID=2815304 RepID=UPI00258F59D2|nr:glycosyltransferase family 2 protein [Snodgrassella sp.]MCO6521370.1 glycosyltransferase family 2 protein [Snodgrassella sp.]